MENNTGLIQDLEEQLARLNRHRAIEQQFAVDSKIRFEQNLLAFTQFYPEIGKSIQQFTPPADFKLIVSECGHGNYIPKGQQVPLYSQTNLLEQVQQQVSRNLQHPKFGRVALYKEKTKGDASDNRIHMRFMTTLSNHIAELTGSSAEPLLQRVSGHYPSFLCFGTGLGYHLQSILNDVSFDYIFLCEPDFDMFYASLFCIDWAQLIQHAHDNGASMFIMLGVTYDIFFQQLTDLTASVGAFSLINSFCYQHYPSAEINKLIKSFFDNFYQLQLGFGFYDDAITGLAHAIRNARYGGHFLATAKARQVPKIPAFVVGNGPSLDEGIELIRAHQGDAVIFAAGTALQSLLNAGIKPDFHVLVERPLSVYQVLTETTDVKSLADLNLLSVEVVYPDTLQHYQWAGLGLKGPEASTVFFQALHYSKHRALLPPLSYAGPLVSNTAASFACQFGFEEIYLFGVDNGYPSDKRESHSKLSIYTNEKYKGRYKIAPDARYKLEGNLGEPVMATNLMVISKQQLESLFGRHKDSQVYKVGWGAKLANTTALSQDDVLILPAKVNKAQLVEKLKADFFQSLEFSEADETFLGVSEFQALVDYLIEIGKRPYQTRREASELLKAQARLVYSYKNTRSPHFFHLIKGTLLYCHCPLITLLYTYENEQVTLDWFRQCMTLWLDCLAEIKQDFAVNWYSKCTTGLHR